MTRLLLLLTLALPLFGAWPNGYTFRRSITIDKTKVPNTNQTDFPVLLCFNGPASAPCDAANTNTLLPQLKVTGSGGEIVNTVTATFPYSHTIPADMVITDTDGSTVLPFEVEHYVTTTGEIYIWVKIGTLTTATDYVIYIYYGNAAVVTNQSNPTGVWNAGYQMVEHLPVDGAIATLNINDSTSTGSTGTNTGATGTPGQIDGAISTATTSFADTGFTPSGITAFTLEAWISANGTATEFPLSSRDSVPANGIFFLYLGLTGPLVGWSNGGAFTLTNWVPGALSFGVYHHLVGTHGAGDNKALFYVDGVENGAIFSDGPNDPGDGASFIIGRDGTAAVPNGFSGQLDEIRFSNVVRAADWIATEYNNMSSPNTFYTLGAQTTFAASTMRHRVIGN